MSSAAEPIDADLEAPEARSRQRHVPLVVLTLLLALGTFLEIGHLARYRTLSPIDELQHLDYVIRVTGFDLPGSGSKVGQVAARAETCARIEMDDASWIPPCVVAPDTVDLSQLQEEGFNTAYVHPPLYYLTNGIVYRASSAVAGDHLDTTTAARLGNLLWVWAAIVFLWLLFTELRASVLVRASLIVLVLSAPTFLHATGAVNPDATAIAVGAAMVWSAIRWERTGRWLLLLPVIALVATFTKVTNLFAVGVACIVLLWPAVPPLFERGAELLRTRGFRSRAEGDEAGDSTAGAIAAVRPRLVAVALTAGATIMGALAFRVLQGLVQEIPANELPMAVSSSVQRFPITGFFPAWHIGVSPLQDPHLAPFLIRTWTRAAIPAVDLFVMVGAVAGTVLAGVTTVGRRLGGAALAMTVACGPAIVAFNYVVSGIYAPVPPRYALSVVPALLAASLPLFRRRWTSASVAALAAFALVPIVVAVIAPAGP